MIDTKKMIILMDKKGWKYRQLADLWGCSVSMAFRILHGERKISTEKMKATKNAFNLSQDEFWELFFENTEQAIAKTG